MLPVDLAGFRVMRHYRTLSLSPDEAAALARLEQTSSLSDSTTSSTTIIEAGSSTSRMEAIRNLLGEDRYQEYERMQDRHYTRLQDVLEDLQFDGQQIVAAYETLKEAQSFSDPAATAMELSQRFGAQAAEAWIETTLPYRPGYEAEMQPALESPTHDTPVTQ